jgi:hypothetical protein
VSSYNCLHILNNYTIRHSFKYSWSELSPMAGTLTLKVVQYYSVTGHSGLSATL